MTRTHVNALGRRRGGRLGRASTSGSTTPRAARAAVPRDDAPRTGTACWRPTSSATTTAAAPRSRQMLAPGRRPDRQRHLGRGHPADRRSLGLRHREGRHRRPHEDARRRVRPARHHRQRARRPARPTRRSTRSPTRPQVRRDLQRAHPARAHRLAPRRSPTRSSSSPRTRRATSPAPSSSSTAASILNGNVGHAHTSSL